tara:strand:- start:25 stop:192 length:168 start_codon:yes stop_codon:yes gene_type:complete
MNVQGLNNDKENIMWHRIIDLGNLEKKYGEGTRWDLDYGKLAILFLCIYIAIKVS